jgi:hypothetical protein
LVFSCPTRFLTSPFSFLSSPLLLLLFRHTSG